jgi:hypothetical protein
MDWIREATGGPGHLRFVLTPVIAIILGLRDGRLDATAGKTPYLWGLVFEHGRKARLGALLRAAAVPLVVAVALDSVLQLYTLRTLHLGWALLVGAILVALPYSIARALTNRAATILRARHTKHTRGSA